MDDGRETEEKLPYVEEEVEVIKTVERNSGVNVRNLGELLAVGRHNKDTEEQGVLAGDIMSLNTAEGRVHISMTSRV